MNVRSEMVAESQESPRRLDVGRHPGSETTCRLHSPSPGWAGARRTALHLAVVGVLMVLPTAGCTELEPQGRVDICAALDDAPEFPGAELDLTLRDLALVPSEEESQPPTAFEECSAGVPVALELRAEGGSSIWLAVGAHLRARELILPEIRSPLEGQPVDLRIRSHFRWGVPNASVALNSQGRTILAMEDDGDLGLGEFSQIGAEAAGAEALPVNPDGCGDVTAHSLRFESDNSDGVARNGETIEVRRDNGREWGVVTNIQTLVRGPIADCSDGPREGLETTWVYTDASF